MGPGALDREGKSRVNVEKPGSPVLYFFLVIGSRFGGGAGVMAATVPLGPKKKLALEVAEREGPDALGVVTFELASLGRASRSDAGSSVKVVGGMGPLALSVKESLVCFLGSVSDVDRVGCGSGFGCPGGDRAIAIENGVLKKAWVLLAPVGEASSVTGVLVADPLLKGDEWSGPGDGNGRRCA